MVLQVPRSHLPLARRRTGKEGQGWEAEDLADDKAFGKCLASLDLSFLISPMEPQISAEYYR